MEMTEAVLTNRFAQRQQFTGHIWANTVDLVGYTDTVDQE